MVAISLYRGNLHRSPDVPRRWLMPNPKISLKDFKSLLARRSKALSKTPQPSTSFNPNPNHGEGPSTTTVPKEEQQIFKEPELVDSKKPLYGSDSLPESKNDALVKPSDDGPVTTEIDPVEICKIDITDTVEKRKKEVEDKLQVLNAKKHNLVLVLKQILNAEEELKKRNSQRQQQVAVSLQADGTNDTGLVTRRLGSEGNLVGDADGGETDDSANHNMQHSRLVSRTCSMSPSSESPLRRTPSVPQNMVSHPARTSLGATGSSPSRFALSGQQGNPVNLPPSVSVSGTGYIASSPSPSPAANGGTSVFRDARHPSPWK